MATHAHAGDFLAGDETGLSDFFPGMKNRFTSLRSRPCMTEGGRSNLSTDYFRLFVISSPE
jgi:hypothetical protein